MIRIFLRKILKWNKSEINLVFLWMEHCIEVSEGVSIKKQLLWLFYALTYLKNTIFIRSKSRIEFNKIRFDQKERNWDSDNVITYVKNYDLKSVPIFFFNPSNSLIRFKDIIPITSLFFACLLNSEILLFYSIVRSWGFSRWASYNNVQIVYYRFPYHSYETILTLMLNKYGIKTFSYSMPIPLYTYRGLIVNHLDFSAKYHIDMYKTSTIRTNTTGYIPGYNVNRIKINIHNKCKPFEKRMKIGLFPTNNDPKYPFYKQELIFAKSFIQLSDYYENCDFTIYPHYQHKKNRDKIKWWNYLIGNKKITIDLRKEHSHDRIHEIDISYSCLSSLGVEFLEAGIKSHYIFSLKNKPYTDLVNTYLKNNIIFVKSMEDDNDIPLVLNKMRKCIDIHNAKKDLYSDNR